MAKRGRSRHFVTAYPNHHEVMDRTSRRLAGKVGHRRLLAIANKLLGEPLIEHQAPSMELMLDDLKQDLHPALDGIHEVNIVPSEMIGRCQSLKPLWHGRA